MLQSYFYNHFTHITVYTNSFCLCLGTTLYENNFTVYTELCSAQIQIDVPIYPTRPLVLNGKLFCYNIFALTYVLLVFHGRV